MSITSLHSCPGIASHLPSCLKRNKETDLIPQTTVQLRLHLPNSPKGTFVQFVDSLATTPVCRAVHATAVSNAWEHIKIQDA